MKYELMIFDLDGTLLDTSPGIFNSVRYAEKKMGFEPIPDERLREFVGPPPREMYKKIYGVDEDTALQAAKYHREYGRTKAIYEASVYPGIEETLKILKDAGMKLAVATLKSQKIAENILENFELLQYFDSVVGMDESETMTKYKTILKVIEETETTGKAVMVGDSQYDLDGAEEAGVDFIAVLYGFGFDKNYPGNLRSKTNVIDNIRNPENFLDIVKG